MPQNLSFEILQNPSHGYTALPPQRNGVKRTSEAPPELRVVLFETGAGQLTITAVAPDAPAPETWWHQAPLEVSKEGLLRQAGRLRTKWRDLVVRHQSTTAEYGRKVGGYPLADAADLSELASLTETLTRELAEEGFDLLEVMLDGNGYDLGRFREFFLDTLADKESLRISFDSCLYLPWPMLAVDPSRCDSPWEAFLGHRHQVEQTNSSYPWEQRPIGHREQAATSLNTDTTLDRVGRAHEVRKLLDQRSRLTVRTHAHDLWAALSSPVLNEDLMYFWCHGHFVDNGTPYPHLAIKLSDGEHIDGTAVSRRRRRMTRTRQARFKPFVLLNACHAGQAATTSQLEHLGKALIDLGADGVLAPQIEIPQIFATEYAYAFLDLYLTGRHSAGEISQLLVQRFASEFHNPLALTYSLYCGINSRLNLAS